MAVVNLSPGGRALALGRRHERAKKKVPNPLGLGGKSGKIDDGKICHKQTQPKNAGPTKTQTSPGSGSTAARLAARRRDYYDQQAKQRQKEAIKERDTKGRAKSTCGNVSTSGDRAPASRDQAGAALGVSGKTVDKAPSSPRGGRSTPGDAHGASANANSGHTALPMSNADKRRAVKLALEAQPKLSDRKIAEHVGAHHQLVASVRKQLDDSSSSSYQEPKTRRGRDGKGGNNFGNVEVHPNQVKVTRLKAVTGDISPRATPTKNHWTGNFSGMTDLRAYPVLVTFSRRLCDD